MAEPKSSMVNGGSDQSPEAGQSKRDRDEKTAATEANGDPSGSQPRSLKRQRRSLSVTSTASEIGRAFFECMDFDNSGFIEEEEAIMLSMVAFGMGQEEAEKQWTHMLMTMDENNDRKISESEYITWWMASSCQRCGSMPSNREWKEGEGDVIFHQEYAIKLLENLQRVVSIKTAKNMCDAFFDAMDENKNGYLEEDEVKSISKWAFGAKQEEADQTWADMLEKMDTNNDRLVSKDEYSSYWMDQAKDKIRPDGTFVDGYKIFLLKKLAKIRAGSQRQNQVRQWDQAYNKSEDAEGEKDESPRASTRIKFQT